MSRTRLRPCSLLPAGVWLLASACGPGAATPMPQPPAFDLDHVGQPKMEAAFEGDNEEIAGDAGAVPARATVRVTNLDRPMQAAAVDAQGDGSFSISVFVTSGQELRFEWQKGNEGSTPADAFFIRRDPTIGTFDLQPSPRFDCLRLSPGYVLEFAEPGTETLTLSNDCDEAITLANPRARIGLPAFTLPTELPTLASGESTDLVIDFAPPDPAAFNEDTLLFDATLGTETIRYPITLRTK